MDGTPSFHLAEGTRVPGARASGAGRQARHTAILLTAAVLVWLGAFLYLTTQAFAGQASTGQAAFYPCDRCHPVFLGADGKPANPLPIGLEKHEIELEAHDVLGAGDAACLACHDDPTRNPGKLIAPDGALVDVTGDVSIVCKRCHFEKYREWQSGVHGKRLAKCSAAGCHDPHTPSWIYISALPPFQGTGLQVHAVGVREPFRPFPGPPVDAPVSTPAWLGILAGLGALLIALLGGYLVFGRRRP